MFASCIDQHELAVAQFAVVVDVVNHQCVGPNTTHIARVSGTVLFLDPSEKSPWTHPEATTGTYAGRSAPAIAHRYSKCAANCASVPLTCANFITSVCASELISAARFICRISAGVFTIRSACTEGSKGLAFPLIKAAWSRR